MNRKLTILSVVIMIILIGFGGKIYMDKRAEEKAKEEQQNLLEAERESVLVLKQTFASIKCLELTKTIYNKTTGSYRMFVKLTTIDNNSVEFTYSFWKENNEIGSYGVENRDVQVKGITTDKITVFYSNGEKEEV